MLYEPVGEIGWHEVGRARLTEVAARSILSESRISGVTPARLLSDALLERFDPELCRRHDGIVRRAFWASIEWVSTDLLVQRCKLSEPDTRSALRRLVKAGTVQPSANVEVGERWRLAKHRP